MLAFCDRPKNQVGFAGAIGEENHDESNDFTQFANLDPC